MNSTMKSFYGDLIFDDLDPRTKDLPLMGSPWSIISIIALYIYFVLVKGAQLMKNRVPYDLKLVIAAYNIFQIVINAFIFCAIFIFAPQLDNFRLFCIPTARHDFSQVGDITVMISYTFYISRVIDFLDTIFFVLRKKFNQITFLHIYHHIIMVLGGYVVMKVESGGGFPTVLAIVNSFVHTIMYSYYFLTNYKPEIKKFLWWKKHITQLQLTQFALLAAYGIQVTCFTVCERPKWFAWVIIVQAFVMLYLFSNFYFKSYVKTKKI